MASTGDLRLHERICELELRVLELSLPQQFTPKQLCEYLQISQVTLYDMKRQGKAPPAIVYSARLVRYDRDDVLEWARKHRVGQCDG